MSSIAIYKILIGMELFLLFFFLHVVSEGNLLLIMKKLADEALLPFYFQNTLVALLFIKLFILLCYF